LYQVGVGDPHAVVLHMPDKNDHHTSHYDTANGNYTNRPDIAISIDSESGVSEDLLRLIIMQLRSCLIDPDVNVIQLASHTLKVNISNFGSDFACA
jgi:hypothetical protein